jgi:hypothetical protein
VQLRQPSRASAPTPAVLGTARDFRVHMERLSWNARHDGTGANSRGPDRRVRTSLPGWEVGDYARPEPGRKLLDSHDKDSSGGAPLALILGISVPGGLILIGLLVWFIHSRNKPLQEQREMKDEHKLVDHKNENQVTADLIFDGGDPPKGPGEPSTLASRASATSAQSALDERRGSAQSSGFAQELRGQALHKRSEENGVVVGVGRVFLEPQTKVHTRVCACVCMYVYKYLYVIYIYIYIYIYTRSMSPQTPAFWRRSSRRWTRGAN